MNQYKKLYWCETYGIIHRRFVIALSKIEAKRIFAKTYGNYISSVESDRILRLPKLYQKDIISFQSGSIECGILNHFPFRFLKDCNAELITINNKNYLIAKRMFIHLDNGKVFSFFSKKKRMYQMYQEIL